MARSLEVPVTLPNLLHAVDRILLRRTWNPARPKPHPAPLRSRDHGIDPTTQRIIDARLAGDTYREIGEMLGVRPTTIRSRLVHAAIDDSLKQKIVDSVRMLARAAGKPSPFPNAISPAVNLSRVIEFIEMRKQGLSLQKIGIRVGLSYERVRQLIAESPPELRATAPKTVRVRKPDPPYFIRGINKRYGGFVKLANRWLGVIGHTYCSLGHHAVPLSEMVGTTAGKPNACCRACNLARQISRYHAPDGAVKEYERRYKAAHPDVGKRASAKWNQAHAGELREIRRKRWEELKADPVRIAKHRGKERERMRKKRETEKSKFGL